MQKILHNTLVRFLAVVGFVCFFLAGASVANAKGAPHAETMIKSNSSRGASLSAPTISTAAAQNGAKVVTLSSNSSYATIYYTIDGTTPTTSSTVYQASFLLDTTKTVKAIAVYQNTTSAAASSTVAVTSASGALVWSEEFSNTSGKVAVPNTSLWAYDAGYLCCSDDELETYCKYNSNLYPCSSSNPNSYVGTDGYLHLIARKPTAGVYTSGRIKTEHNFSFRYGRVEVRAKLPVGQGLWPAIWALGNNIDVASINWPTSGEIDIMEHINPSTKSDWYAATIHSNLLGTTSNNVGQSKDYYYASGDSAAAWHTYGVIWKSGTIIFYIDTPSNVVGTLTPSSYQLATGGAWPYDGNQSAFLLLNLAVGGYWPGSPDSTTAFPAEMLVDYVRIYKN